MAGPAWPPSAAPASAAIPRAPAHERVRLYRVTTLIRTPPPPRATGGAVSYKRGFHVSFVPFRARLPTTQNILAKGQLSLTGRVLSQVLTGVVRQVIVVRIVGTGSWMGPPPGERAPMVGPPGERAQMVGHTHARAQSSGPSATPASAAIPRAPAQEGVRKDRVLDGPASGERAPQVGPMVGVRVVHRAPWVGVKVVHSGHMT